MPVEEDNWRPRGNIWVIAIVVTLGAFMEVLDTTIVNVALPHIAGSLSVSDDDATWSLTVYLIANGALDWGPVKQIRRVATTQTRTTTSTVRRVSSGSDAGEAA